MIKKMLQLFNSFFESLVLEFLLWFLLTAGSIVALLGGMSWELWFIGSAIICGFLYIGSKLKNNKPEEISSNVKQLLNEGGSTIGLTPDIDNLTTLLDNLNKITKKKQL